MPALTKLIPVLLLLSLLLTLTPPPGSRVIAAGGYERAIVTARTEIWKDINSGRAGSATAAIMDNGEIVYSEGFGPADREKGIPVDRNTIFNIGSISKAFTATAIMLLVDQGKVALDDPAVSYLPEFTMADPRYRDITVRMLLNHTSGLPGSSFANAFGFEYNNDVFKDLLAALSRAHLRHAPGELAVYTNDGFTLAEMVVERVSGKKFVDFLAEFVFQPLGMHNSGRGVGEQRGKMAAAYYEPISGRRHPLEVVSTLGAGGLSSTAEDLVRFADTFSYAGNRIFTRSSLEEMKRMQPARLSVIFKNPGIAWGLGLDFVDMEKYRRQGIKVMGKEGAVTNYHAMLLSAPEQRLTVAVIETGMSASAQPIALAMMDALLVEKGLVKSEDKGISGPSGPTGAAQPIPPEYSGFEGYYLLPMGAGIRKIEFDPKENTVKLLALKDGVETPEGALAYRDGNLYDPGGFPAYFVAVGDRKYVVAPSLLGDSITMEKLEKPVNPQSLRIDVKGKWWLRRNAKPFEVVKLTAAHMGKSDTIEQLPGYVNFGAIMAVQSPDFAGMPVSAIRDQEELWLVEKGGETWVQANDLLYSPASAAGALKKGENTVSLGNSGYNEWLKSDEDLILSFRKPAKGRVIVFSPDGVPMYDSALDKGETFIGKGGYVEFAGYPGDVFRVTAR